MLSQVICDKRSEMVTKHLTDTDTRHLTTDPPPYESQVSRTVQNTISAETPIIIIESMKDINPSKHFVSTDLNKPGSKQTVTSLPSSNTNIKILNESKVSTLKQVLHIVSDSSVIGDRKDSPIEEMTTNNLFKCEICNYSSNNKHYLKQHVDLVHNADRPYKCPHCDYAGKRSHSLREHLVVHSNERPYECTHCNATFRKKGHLTNHVKLHATPKTIKCSLCSPHVTFLDHEHYIEHLRSVHKTTKLFACDICDFATQTEESIRHHILQYHSSPKLYQCTMCSFVTKDFNLMPPHLESHSKSKEANPQTQNSSGSTTEGLTQLVQPTDLRQKPLLIKCSECGYTTYEKETMKNHMLKHIDKSATESSPVKPQIIKPSLPQNASYKCTDCSFTSTDATVFVHHMLVHKTGNKEKKDDNQTVYIVKPVTKENTCLTGTAPFYHDEKTGRFICTICGYGCEYQRTIKSHIWKHSGNKDIVYPMFQNGPLSVYEDNNNIQIHEFIPKVEGQSSNSSVNNLNTSSQTVMANVGNRMKQNEETTRIKLHEFSKMEKHRPVFTSSILDANPKAAVIVESVQAVPSTHGLTGMSSQPASPKRPCSPAESESDSNKKLKTDEKDEHLNDNTVTEDVGDLLESNENNQVDTDLDTSHIAEEVIEDEDTEYSNTRSKLIIEKKIIDTDENPEVELVEELVSTDNETTNSNNAGGICSSLLAVIEQLRERSKTEVDAENDTKEPTGKKLTPRRRSRKDSSDDELPAEFADSIEKITEDRKVKYRCKFCHYSNSKALLIRIHMRLHKSKKPFECSLCNFVAKSSEDLQTHMIMHCKVRTYQCKLCPSAFNYKSQLRAHMRAHTEKDTFICDFCDFVTSNLTAYRQHTLVHSDTAYYCNKCHKRFSTKKNLSSHICGNLHRDSVEEDVDISSEDETNEANKEFKCSLCNFTTFDINEISLHTASHTEDENGILPLKCELCDFTAVSNRSLKSHMKRHINDQRYVQQPLEQYKCNLCGYVCHHLPSLKSHMWRHASDRNYSYEFTNEVINAAIDFDIRLDGRDVNDPEILEKVLSSERKIVEGRLNNTEKLGGKMPVCLVTFRCCQCGYETINKPELNVHMRTHSDIIQQTLEISKDSENDLKSDTCESQQKKIHLVYGVKKL